MAPDLPRQLFDAAGLATLQRLLDIDVDAAIQDFAIAERVHLAELELLITGWGAPYLGAPELGRMPRLRAVFHAAGSTKRHLGREVWERGILVTTAAAANAKPVSEYTLAMILLAGKGALEAGQRYQRDPNPAPPAGPIGNYGLTVGIIGASRVGRRVIDLLQPFDVEILLYDPLLAPDDPIHAKARSMPLDELCARSRVLSVHAPLLHHTRGLVGRAQLQRMPDGATLINSARGGVIDEPALAAELRAGRLRAILDVTDQEPLPLDHELRTLPHVLLTPHVAGAQGNELRRLGESALTEIERFCSGLPPLHPVPLESLDCIA